MVTKKETKKKTAAKKTIKKVAKKPASKKTNKDSMAVIKTGGKQYLVKEGDVLKVEKIAEEDIKAGKITFDEVLLVDDGKDTKVGTPTVKGAKVVAEVVNQVKDKKVTVIRFRSKSRYFKKKGHRQPVTFVKVKEIK
jgi:large subunit ribosomal protein L21